MNLLLKTYIRVARRLYFLISRMLLKEYSRFFLVLEWKKKRLLNLDSKIEIEIKKKLENEATIFFDELTRSITPLSFEEFDVVINDKKGEVYINGFYLDQGHDHDRDLP